MTHRQLRLRRGFNTLAAGGASRRRLSRKVGRVNLMAAPWAWGAAGAFIYAAPALSTCLFASRESGTLCLKCWVDGVFSMAIGPIAAAAFTGTVQGYVGMTGSEHIPAVGATIGILANPLAPGAIKVITEGILKRIQTLIGGDA